MSHGPRAAVQLRRARGPLSLERLSALPDGRLAYRMKRASPTGETHLVLSPVAFLRRMAALVPPPRANLVRYFGVFASNARVRPRVVPTPPAPALPQAASCPMAPAPSGPVSLGVPSPGPSSSSGRSRPTSHLPSLQRHAARRGRRPSLLSRPRPPPRDRGHEISELALERLYASRTERLAQTLHRFLPDAGHALDHALAGVGQEEDARACVVRRPRNADKTGLLKGPNVSGKRRPVHDERVGDRADGGPIFAEGRNRHEHVPLRCLDAQGTKCFVKDAREEPRRLPHKHAGTRLRDLHCQSRNSAHT